MANHFLIMRRLDKAMRSLRGLPAMAVASSKQSGKVPLDSLLNRAVKYISVIKTHADVEEKRGAFYKEKVDRVMKEAWLIYSRLQRMKDADQHMFGNTENSPSRTISVESASMRSGVERGFSHIKWEHRVWQAQPKKTKPTRRYVKPGPVRNLEDTDYWVFKKERKNESDN